MKSGAEYDCFTRWRHYYTYLTRPGVKKSIKRGYTKRERRLWKKERMNEPV